MKTDNTTPMEDKHTPGPWQLTTIPFELRNTDSAAAIYGPMSEQGGACLIADISRSAGDTQATANAELIAKAPELLQANRELVEALDEARLQLEYLNKKFSETGTTNSVLSRIKTLLTKYKDL